MQKWEYVIILNTCIFLQMKAITLILNILWMLQLGEGKTGNYLNGLECLAITEETKADCDDRCAHKICLEDRYRKDEEDCYDKHISQIPADELMFIKEKPTKHTKQLRKYFAILAKDPKKMQPEVPKTENLLEIGSEDYVKIIRAILPMSDYKTNICDATMDYAKITKWDPEWTYASCKEPEHEKCQIFMENKLRSYAEFRKILKELQEKGIVYALNKLPIYNQDVSKSVALNYQSIINDHLAMHMATEIKKRETKDAELTKELDDLKHSLATTSMSIRTRMDNNHKILKDSVATNILELNKKADRIPETPKKVGERNEDGMNGSGNTPPQDINMKGEPGQQGAVGPPGTCSEACTTRIGERGRTGAPGAVGHTGPEGRPGSNGRPGVSGPKGEKGDIGATGEPGVSGIGSEADWKYLDNMLDMANKIEAPTKKEEELLRQIEGEQLAIEDHSRISRDTRKVIIYAASSLLKVPIAKLRAVEALANNLLNNQKIKIEKSFREIATAGWKQTKSSFMEAMNQKLSEHPLFLNRARYDANVNLTKGEFDRYLNEMSKDPYGTFAMVSMAASFFAALSVVGTCYMNYRAIQRTKAGYKFKKDYSQKSKGLKEENKKLLGKFEGPDPRPERKKRDNRRCAEEEPISMCEYRRPLPEAPEKD